MKTLVIMERGELAGLVRYDEEEQVEGGPNEIRLEPMVGQEIHEIELPPELEGTDSVLDLFEVVQREYVLDTKSSTLARKGRLSS